MNEASAGSNSSTDPGQRPDHERSPRPAELLREQQVQRATYRISQAAVTADSLQQLYERIHHIIAELMPAGNLYLALRDPQTGSIIYPYYVDECDVVPPDPQTAETGLTACILCTGESLLLSDFEKEELIRSGQLVPTGTRPSSWLGVPLKLGGKPIGVIAVQVYEDSYRYTEQDRDILGFVADQIAVSIDRQRAHDALAASEECFRLAAQSSSDVVYEWDVATDRCVYFGATQGLLATSIGGFPARGSAWNSFVHPDDRPRLDRAAQEHLATGQPMRIVYRVRCADGSWRTITESSQTVRGSDGTVIKWVGSNTDITERMQMEEALRNSEARMRAIFAAMTDIIIVLDQNGRCIEVVPTSARITAWEPARLIGRTVHDVLPRDLADAFLKNIRKALATHATVEMEYDLDVAKTRRWFEVGISALASDQAMVVAHDATARHSAQMTARAEALKAESYFNTSGVIMEVIDTNLRLVRLNNKGYEFFGYRPEEIIGTDWFDIKLPERERTRVKAMVHGELAGQSFPLHTEQTVVTRTGEERIVDWHDAPLRDGDGTITGLVSSGVDVTDRVRAERARQASELKFRELFNQARDAILLHVVDNDAMTGPIIEANGVACEWTGYSREELLGLTITDIFDNSPELRARIIRQLKDQKTMTFTAVLKARDSRTVPVEDTASLFTLEGTPVVLSILHDITERLRIESELQRMDKLESLGVMAGGIAHDFNNMLTGIVGNIELARTEEWQDRSRVLLDEAEQEILRARGLTQQLLTFARGGEPVRSVQDLAPILREVTAFALHGSDVRAVMDFSEGLWPANVDRGQISQVFSNMVINADEAMLDGGTLSVSAHNVLISDPVPHPDLVPGCYVQVDISDTGTGIPESDLHKIFDPFFSTKGRGSGLGLTTAYAIVRKHGGCIQIASTPGKGTTFSIYLPAIRQRPVQADTDRSVSVRGHGRVLVVDDEATVQRVLVAMLDRLGYEAEAVFDGKDAIRADAEAQAAGTPFNVIIMDLTIPGGMGGREAAGILRAQHTTAQLVVSSGYATDPVMANYRSCQFDAVLAKPYSFTELNAVLASLAGCSTSDLHGHD